MTHDPCQQQIQAARERLQVLRQRARTSPEPSTLLLETLEALALATEQLQVNAEQLAAAHEVRAAEALRQSEERFRCLSAWSPVGIFLTDPLGQCTYTNPRWQSIAGLTSAEAAGTGWVRAVHSDDREGVVAAWTQAAQQGQQFAREFRVRTRAGTVKWVHARSSPMRSDTGHLIGHVGTVEEITDRKQADQRLATERARLAVTLRSIGDSVIATDKQGRIVLMNEVAEARTGWTRDRALGKPLSEVVPRLGARTLAEQDPQQTVVEEASAQAFELRLKPISDGPEAGGWVLVERDVTREHEAQHMLERQARLAAVGQLAAGVAHDFNNILTVVITVAERLKIDATLSHTARQLLGMVAQQGRRGSQLIRQILDFSRRSSPAERAPVDLKSLLLDTANLLRRTIPERIVLETEFAPGEYPVRANASQVQEVLTNLAVNASDAMPQGGQLRVGLSRLVLQPGQRPPVTAMAPGEWAVLSVADTGVGMPPEVLRHVFEPFFTTKEPSAGTGLGLAQVYELVEQHGGFIDIASEVGRGTTFTIYLPVSPGELAVATAGLLQTLPHGRGETILVVEDDASVRDVNAWLLTDLGYRVLPAGAAAEALHLYRTHRDEIALVLTDMVMPVLDGAALCRDLHQCDANLPIIVLSGYPLTMETQHSLPRTVGWLQKPSDPQHLATAVRRALDSEAPVGKDQSLSGGA